MRKRLGEIAVSGGINLLEVLFIVFLVLKLTGVINWSWWLVTAPLWGCFCLLLGIYLIVLFFIVIAAIIRAFRKNKYD